MPYKDLKKAQENKHKYYLKNKNKILQYNKEWRQENKNDISKYSKEYYRNNKETMIKNSKVCRLKSPLYWKQYDVERHLKRNYGMTINQLEQMWISQNGRCAICNQEFIDRKDTHIDHNHTTGQIRQLLCRNCNWMIGLAKENPFILQNAKSYVEKWNK